MSHSDDPLGDLLGVETKDTKAVKPSKETPSKAKIMDDLFSKKDDDDLFAGLGTAAKTAPKKTETTKSGFMAELFGSKEPPKARRGSDFELDDAYKKPSPAPNPPPVETRGRRRGNPVVSAKPDFDLDLKPAVPVASSSLAVDSKPVEIIDGVSLDNQKIMNDQLNQMKEFELKQREQFRRDLEEQQRMMAAKQREYQTAIEQQKATTQNQVSMIQERQKAMLKQQQEQTEILLKQMQSQMEADIRLKGDMTRNQLQVLGEIQLQNPSEVAIDPFKPQPTHRG